MLEQPAGLVPAKDWAVQEEAKKALRPPHSTFSKFFPRIYGTPPKRIPFKGRRNKPAADWSKTGCHAQAMAFLEWADKVLQARAKKDETFKLTTTNLRPEIMQLFSLYTKLVYRVAGSQKETMKRFVLTTLAELRTEMETAS